MVSEFERLVAAAVTRDNAIIENAVERALVAGEHGVKVIRRNGVLVSAEPDAEVPYGTIHEHLLDG